MKIRSKAAATERSWRKTPDKEVEVNEANKREAVRELRTVEASCSTGDRRYSLHQLLGEMMGLVWPAGLYCPVGVEAMTSMNNHERWGEIILTGGQNQTLMKTLFI